MPTVAITGISGKSGRFLLKRISQEIGKLSTFHFIFLYHHRSPLNDELTQEDCQKLVQEGRERVEFLQADLTDQENVNQIFKTRKVDILLHIAGIKYTLNLVTPALQAGVRHLILVHTTGIYSKYKAAGEEYRNIEKSIRAEIEGYNCQGADVALTILRPTMIYGDLKDKNISIFIKMVDKLRIFPTVNGARYDLQPVWCKDLGDAYFEILKNSDVAKNKEYILSGGAPIQLREMFEVIARQLGVKNHFISCPFCVAYAGAWLLFLLSFGRIDFREKVQRLVEPRSFSHELATKDFGYQPEEFEDGVKDEIEMYRLNERVTVKEK